MVLQISGGYWYYSFGVENCGTQLKLSALLTSVLFILIGYIFINEKKSIKMKVTWLYILGNYSFGDYSGAL